MVGLSSLSAPPENCFFLLLRKLPAAFLENNEACAIHKCQQTVWCAAGRNQICVKQYTAMAMLKHSSCYR